MYLLSVLLLLYSYFSINPSPQVYILKGYAQGTTYTITYYASDSILKQNDVDSVIAKVDSSMSIYKPYSQISKFNAAARGLVIDTLFQTVIKKSNEVFVSTSGAFDITIYPLVRAWGFGAGKPLPLPRTSDIDNLRRCVGSQKIELNNYYLQKKIPCVQIDVNGIAQGFTVDLLANMIERKGSKNYLVELGGEIRVKGRKPSGETFAIGIETPLENEFDVQPMRKLIAIEEGAITTSGNYRRFYESGSKRITHLIDPASGHPVDNELISVTVYAKDAITADGFDNAFMVMGLKKSMAFLERRKDMEAYFIYRNTNGNIADTATAGFNKFILN